jgi:uncharacterized MAPEG superfamily protein
MHWFAILGGVDFSARLPEDKLPVNLAGAKPEAGSLADRLRRIANNNAENIWQAIIVFYAANQYAYGLVTTDNTILLQFLTGDMYAFLLFRVVYFVLYYKGINGTPPLRTIVFMGALLSSLFALCTIPYCVSQLASAP